MKSNRIVSGVVIFFAVNLAASAQIAVGELTGTVRNDFYPGAGYEFFAPATTGTTINALGYWDQGGDGLLKSHTVSLYSYAGFGSTYNLLTTVTVSAGSVDPLVGGYRWVSIPDLALTDNGQGGGYYAILASHDTDSWADGIGGYPIMNPAIGTISGTGLIDAGTGQTITQSQIGLVGNLDPNTVYGGANLGYITVPEPTSCALLGIGVLVLVIGHKNTSRV